MTSSFAGNHSAVLKYFTAHPKSSLRRAALDLQLPRFTIEFILRRKIHMFPYKIRRFQQLRQQESTERKQFATWCFDKMYSDSTSLQRIVFFWWICLQLRAIKSRGSGGHIIRVWYKGMSDRHSEKITVSFAVKTYYFDNETVRGEDYQHLLNTYVRNSNHLFLQNHLLREDGAPAYTSNLVRPLLCGLFPSSRIGECYPYHCPARSPDMTTPDFLCGIRKEEVFRTPLTNMSQLKRRISRVVRCIID